MAPSSTGDQPFGVAAGSASGASRRCGVEVGDAAGEDDDAAETFAIEDPAAPPDEAPHPARAAATSTTSPPTSQLLPVMPPWTTPKADKFPQRTSPAATATAITPWDAAHLWDHAEGARPLERTELLVVAIEERRAPHLYADAGWRPQSSTDADRRLWRAPSSLRQPPTVAALVALSYTGWHGIHCAGGPPLPAVTDSPAQPPLRRPTRR